MVRSETHGRRPFTSERFWDAFDRRDGIKVDLARLRWRSRVGGLFWVRKKNGKTAGELKAKTRPVHVWEGDWVTGPDGNNAHGRTRFFLHGRCSFLASCYLFVVLSPPLLDQVGTYIH